MFKIILFYIAISAIVYIRNKYFYIKCTYLINSLRENKNNCNYIIPVNSILRKANLFTFERANPQRFVNSNYIEDICDCLLIAKGIFHTYCKRSPLWLYYLISNMSIFSLVRKTASSRLCTIFYALVEWFFLYLLGLFLDTSGIGSKILKWLYVALNYLINTLQDYH